MRKVLSVIRHDLSNVLNSQSLFTFEEAPMAQKKEDRRVKYTKMVLRDSLIKLLSQKDISHITIKEICDAADVNRATFYAHYTDPYDLLEKIENELFDNIQRHLKEHEQVSSLITLSGMNEAVRMVTDIFDYLRENASLCKLLLNDRGNLNFQKRLMSLVYNPYFQQFSKTGTYTEAETEYVYAFALMGAVGAVQTWLEDDLPQSSGFIAELLVRLFYQLALGKPEIVTRQDAGANPKEGAKA